MGVKERPHTFKTSAEERAFEHNEEHGGSHDACARSDGTVECFFCGWPQFKQRRERFERMFQNNPISVNTFLGMYFPITA